MLLNKVVTQEDKQMRLSGRGILYVMLGTAVLAFLFISFGRFELARPTMVSVAMVGLAITMRWKLRKHVWFWITMTILAALHLPLILFVPWTTRWIPAILIAPVGIADLYAMLWVISVVAKSKGEPIAPSGNHPRSRAAEGRDHSL
jgi:hypothetical protein